MLSLERLAEQCERDPQRIALSATQRPLEEVARLVGGDRPVTIVDAGVRKELDLRGRRAGRGPGRARRRHARGQDRGRPGRHRRRRRARSGRPSTPSCSSWCAAHRSTLVFVNSRRLAERLALRLNELAEEPIARAHHGSVSREARVEIEEALKSGDLPCLVATSSLELGIDMGAIDLVIQVESPGSVARGLQRIGRAGHQVGEPSRGRDLPEVPRRPRRVRGGRRADARGRDRGRRASRGTRSTCSASRSWRCAPSADLVGRRAVRPGARAPTRTASCPRTQLEGVLDMLAGRYPSDEFAELRPAARLGPASRAPCGRATAPAGWPSPTPARSPTAACSASSWPTAAGASASSTRRWSTRPARARCSCSAPRPGGSRRSPATASSSRPAPGAPGAIPFWKGEEVGRPVELGAAIGAFCRELAALPDERGRRAAAGRSTTATSGPPATSSPTCASRRRPPGVVPVRPRAGGRALPRRDRRLAALPALALRRPRARARGRWRSARSLRREHGIEAQAVWSDDGIILHLPDADAAAGPRARGARPGRASRTCWSASSAARRCTAPASARTPPGRC